MDINFNSLTELKERIRPALHIKVSELKANYHNIAEDDIWEYLKKTWQSEVNLTLYDIVNDIINLDDEDLIEFAMKRSMKYDKE